MSYGLISPFTYNSYYSSPAQSSVSRYSDVNLLIGDAYKEQQYWLSVYNQAQQFGIKGTSIEDILTQLLRTQEKLNGLQQRILPAAEGYLRWENETNQNIRRVFQNQQGR